VTFKKGKQKFSKEEIIDILKRNVNLFREEEEFVQYIVDLAMYLVEHRLQTQTEVRERKSTGVPVGLGTGIEKRNESFKRTRDRDEELYRVLKKHSTRSDAVLHCRMCGAPVVGRATCPNCGNMAF
jgi:rubrerythrin